MKHAPRKRGEVHWRPNAGRGLVSRFRGIILSIDSQRVAEILIGIAIAMGIVILCMKGT